MHSRDVDRKLGIALHRMTSESAAIVKDALGPRVRPQSAMPSGSSVTSTGSISGSITGSTHSIVINTGSSVDEDDDEEEENKDKSIEDEDIAARLTDCNSSS